jgi:protein tyrosine/serine phosphatase
VVVALALTVAGVRAQDVVEDYAASGDRAEAIVARLRRSRTYARDIDSKPVTAHRVRAETMAAFLEQMAARYDGVTRWLTDHSLVAEDLQLLRAKLRDSADRQTPEDSRRLAVRPGQPPEGERREDA